MGTSRRTTGLERWRGETDVKLDGIKERVDEIAGTIAAGFKATSDSLASHAQEDRQAQATLHKRITVVEGGYNRLLGKVAGVVLALSLLGGFLAQALAKLYGE